MPNRIPIHFIESDETAEDKTSWIEEQPAVDFVSSPSLDIPSMSDDSEPQPVSADLIDPFVEPEAPIKSHASASSQASQANEAAPTAFTKADSGPLSDIPRPAVSANPFDENIEIEPEDKPNHEVQAVTATLERVEAELALVDAERQNLTERLTRVSADFDNYRKRADREKSRTYQSIVGEVVQQLLPVHDNLARALEAEASVQATESEEFRHFLNGVELIYRQLDEILKGMGLQPVETVGQTFDPHVHEAVATEQTDEYEPDTVTQELVRGYRLGDTLLRPAMVKVSTR